MAWLREARKLASPRQGGATAGGTCASFCQAESLTAAEADARDIARVVNTGVAPHVNAICKGLSNGILTLATGITGC